MNKDRIINRQKLADTVAAQHNVEGHKIVAAVVLTGDKGNHDLLLKMNINDPDERIRAIHALGKVRTKLNVWPEED